MADEALPVPPPGMTMIENVSLEKFEQAVYRRDYEEASGMLLQNLRKFKAGAPSSGTATTPTAEAALHAVLRGGDFARGPRSSKLSQHGFDLLASEHAVMDLLFRASAFETSDHLLALGAIKSEVSVQHITIESGPALAKFLLTYSLVSALAMDFERTFEKDPQAISLALYAGMLSPLLTIAPEAHDRRESNFSGCTSSSRTACCPSRSCRRCATRICTRRTAAAATSTTARRWCTSCSAASSRTTTSRCRRSRPSSARNARRS
jgi:hypothetical protein